MRNGERIAASRSFASVNERRRIWPPGRLSDSMRHAVGVRSAQQMKRNRASLHLPRSMSDASREATEEPEHPTREDHVIDQYTRVRHLGSAFSLRRGQPPKAVSRAKKALGFRAHSIS